MKIVEQFFIGWDNETFKINSYGICDSDKTARLLVKKIISEAFPKDQFKVTKIKDMENPTWKMESRFPDPTGRKEVQFIWIKDAHVITEEEIATAKPIKLKTKFTNQNYEVKTRIVVCE